MAKGIALMKIISSIKSSHFTTTLYNKKELKREKAFCLWQKAFYFHMDTISYRNGHVY